MIRQDEYHDCPSCRRRSRHRVSRDRVLAPVMWCQSCFHVWIGASEPPQHQAPAGSATTRRNAA